MRPAIISTLPKTLAKIEVKKFQSMIFRQLAGDIINKFMILIRRGQKGGGKISNPLFFRFQSGFCQPQMVTKFATFAPKAVFIPNIFY